MSLTKQLWLAIALVLTLAFGCSIVVSVLSARHYLQQQLQVKNIDNATSLALSLSQLDKDPVTVELQVAAQFDAGHYQYIRITSPTGQVLVEKTFSGQRANVPGWFTRLIPIHAEPGRAQISDGWNQFGTLTLASHDQYVYKSLWDGTLDLLMWFVLGGIVTGFAGSQAIRIITRPLESVVAQAHAISQRQFLTVPEPTTLELRSVVRAMNAMVLRIKAMLTEEAMRLDALRKKVNQDPVSGLAGREYFLSHLREMLRGERFPRAGSLVLVRLTDINALNSVLGHQRTDELLKTLGTVLYDSGNDHPGQRAGRIKGSEFAVACPSMRSPTEAAQDIHHRLSTLWLPRWSAEAPDLFHVAAVAYHRDQPVGELLAQADEAMAVAQSMGPNNWYAREQEPGHPVMNADAWRALLTEAVAGNRLSLVFYPVVNCHGPDMLHSEALIRLQQDGEQALWKAGDFMPMAAHLNLSGALDLQVVRMALGRQQATGGDIAVNLAADTLSDFQFRNDLTRLLMDHPQECRHLLFEVPEYGVLKHFEAFLDLAHTLKALECRVGIESFGQRFSQSDRLADLGLDYIKLHPSYVHDLQGNTGNQEFLRGMCTLAHGLGIAVIATGVAAQDDLPLLTALGFDGAAGPGLGVG